MDNRNQTYIGECRSNVNYVNLYVYPWLALLLFCSNNDKIKGIM